MEKNIYTGEILYVAQNRNLIKELKFNEIGVRVLMKFKKLLALMMVCMFVLTGCNKTNKKSATLHLIFIGKSGTLFYNRGLSVLN